MDVLISGTGVAGPALAFWLARQGHRVEIVEKAPEPRRGGYMLDFWGLGYDVAERMGLLPALKARSYDIRSLKLVDARGRRIAEVDASAFVRGLGGRFFSIPRGDLALTLYEALPASVNRRFADSVAALEQDGGGVEVRFAGGDTARYDLVIGADGLHSQTRTLLFGPVREHWLGYVAAVFLAEDYPYRDEGSYLTFGRPGRQIGRYALRGGRSGFLVLLAAKELPQIASHDLAAQKDYIARALAGMGWETAEILAALARSSELYFDAVSQIRLPRWSMGRVALIGDAAHSPSLMAGEGSGLAMLGAYVLAGELSRAPHDPAAAFAAYEARLKALVEKKQRSAARFAATLAPRTQAGIVLRDNVMRLAQWRWLGERLLGNSFRDDFVMPDY